MNKALFIIFFSLIACTAFSQSRWTLSKDEDGIKVYTAEVPNTNFKKAKVECTLAGTYDKLISILTNVEQYKNWVYNNKTAYILKRISPTDLYYYSETSLPWPVSNRDVISHMTIERDKQDRFLKVNEVSVPNFIPQKDGKVRVQKSIITWFATMPTASTIHIVYTFEADPGGSLPGWLVNNFADKGPMESFKKLRDLLKK